jgi:hypothetical protein
MRRSGGCAAATLPVGGVGPLLAPPWRQPGPRAAAQRPAPGHTCPGGLGLETVPPRASRMRRAAAKSLHSCKGALRIAQVLGAASLMLAFFVLTYWPPCTPRRRQERAGRAAGSGAAPKASSLGPSRPARRSVRLFPSERPLARCAQRALTNRWVAQEVPRPAAQASRGGPAITNAACPSAAAAHAARGLCVLSAPLSSPPALVQAPCRAAPPATHTHTSLPRAPWLELESQA